MTIPKCAARKVRMQPYGNVRTVRWHEFPKVQRGDPGHVYEVSLPGTTCRICGLPVERSGERIEPEAPMA